MKKIASNYFKLFPIFFFIMSLPLLGNDVAIITFIEGNITAKLGHETWNPSIGESLISGTELSVNSPGEKAKFIYLPKNQEIEISEPGNYKITEENISGKLTKILDLQGNIPSLEFNTNHIELGGAITADGSAAGSAVSGMYQDQEATTQYPSTEITQSTSAEKTYAIEHDESFKDDVESKRESSFKSLKKTHEIDRSATNWKIRIAFPIEITKLLQPQFNFSGTIEGFCHRKTSLLTEWDIFEITFSRPPHSETISIPQKTGKSLEVVLLRQPATDEDNSNQVIFALQSEVEGRLEQAAGIWFDLMAKPKINEKIVKAHLKRLYKKLIEKYMQK